ISETSLIGLSYRRASVMKFTSTMSIQDNEVSSVSLYPNPAHDVVILANLPHGETHIKVFDLSGKEVFSKYTNSETTTINTAQFTNGNYLLRIDNNGNIANRKLMINK